MKSVTIKIMEDAVHKAGRRLIRDYGELEHLQVSKKGTADFVTSADLRAEKILIEELMEKRPDYGFLVEEAGEIEGKDERFRWIIDPLDGTYNYMHGLPHFCISVALEKNTNGKREIVAGVISAPILRENFWAEQGEGMYYNDRRVQVSGRQRLDDALVAGYVARGYKEQTIVDVERFTSVGCNVRVMGAAALELAYVASGKLDGFWHHSLKPWDMAAGILMVREARGMVTTIDGGSDMMDSGSILATNSGLNEVISKSLKACG